MLYGEQLNHGSNVSTISKGGEKKISGECGVMRAHTYYNRSFGGIKGYLDSIWPAMNSQFSSRRPGLSDSRGRGGLTMSPLLTAVLQRG